MSSYTEDVFQAIYEKILDGTLPPGEKLHIANLAKMYDVGLSPIREALSRLTATNLVIAKSQRGFIVSPLSLEDLEDVYATRMHIEKVGISLSIENGDESWEANLLATFHQLAHIEKKIECHTTESYKTWEKYHRAFNAAQMAACGLTHLLQIQERLYLETERYRRIWFFAGMKQHKVLSFSYNQKAILDAALAHDAKKATQLLEQHFNNAIALISSFLKGLNN